VTVAICASPSSWPISDVALCLTAHSFHASICFFKACALKEGPLPQVGENCSLRQMSCSLVNNQRGQAGHGVQPMSFARTAAPTFRAVKTTSALRFFARGAPFGCGPVQ